MSSVYESFPVRASYLSSDAEIQQVIGFEDHRLSYDFPRTGTFNFLFLGVFENSFILNVNENVSCLEVKSQR